MDNANLIIPRLWLGNKGASMDSEFLKKNNITVVFNCTKDLPFHSSIIKRYRVPVDDNLEPVEINNMRVWAPEIVYKVLREYRAGHTILVHCFAGMQRSAAVVAMTLIVLTKKSPDEIMAKIREIRPIAFFPAANFEKSIRNFDQDFKKELAN
jgi:protein tyrosine phosphatase